MRLLVDNNLPPSLALALPGWDVLHAREIALHAAPDQALFDFAALENRILLSLDADFGAILARLGTRIPSVVLIRRPDLPTASFLGPVLRVELPRFEQDLRAGALVILESRRIRCRPLPLT